MTDVFKQLFERVVSSTDLKNILIAFGIIVAALVAQRFVTWLISLPLKRLVLKTGWVERKQEGLVNGILRPVRMAVLISGVYFALISLALPTEPYDIPKVLQEGYIILQTVMFAWFAYNFVDILDAFVRKFASQTDTTLDDHMVPFLRKTLRIFIVVMAAMMAVQNLGYSISGLLASLGIGGIAIALAARETLSNLLASFQIILDRPFNLGDWIKTDSLEGIVESVGFRSTRIRTFAKTLVVVPNAELASATIDNISQRPKRRIKSTIDLTYNTTPAQMREFVSRVKKMLEDHPSIDNDLILVYFDEYKESSLSVMLYYFSVSPDWIFWLEAKQDTYLKIAEIVDDMGLEFAFPTQTLHVESLPPAIPETI